jgi:hypothetical protein
MTLNIARWVRKADNPSAKVKAPAIKRAKITPSAAIMLLYLSLTSYK